VLLELVVTRTTRMLMLVRVVLRLGLLLRSLHLKDLDRIKASSSQARESLWLYVWGSLMN